MLCACAWSLGVPRCRSILCVRLRPALVCACVRVYVRAHALARGVRAAVRVRACLIAVPVRAFVHDAPLIVWGCVFLLRCLARASDRPSASLAVLEKELVRASVRVRAPAFMCTVHSPSRRVCVSDRPVRLCVRLCAFLCAPGA